MFDRARTSRRSILRPWTIAGAALLVLVAFSLAAEFRHPLPPPAKPLPTVAASVAPVQLPPLPAPTAAPEAVQPPTTRPSFDIVRVDPQGNAVMAGRAAPDAEVVLRDGDRVTGRTNADRAGQWVFIPTEPMTPGARELTVETPHQDGKVESGDASVLLVIPDRKAATANDAQAPGPLAVLTPTAPAAAPRLLQTGAKTAFGLDVLDYDDQGGVRFAGHAPAGALIRLYVDDQSIGEAIASAARTWSFVPQIKIAAGQHQLRLDQVGPDGKVSARVELAMMRDTPSVEPGTVSHLTVQPGETLWRLAHDTYGHGTRYTLIYESNRDLIRNPDLIFPGQIFSLPPAPPEASGIPDNPVSSSKSR
jgi:hypothetical protein